MNRAPVAIAIGTEGTGPVLSQLIRAAIDRMLSPRLGRIAEIANGLRQRVGETLPAGAPRRRFWAAFFSGAPARAIERGDEAAALAAVSDMLAGAGPKAGSVALVGAGPAPRTC